jgi:CRP/FNR family transcriptional regulator, nitrogen oxide reductase regulator
VNCKCKLLRNKKFEGLPDGLRPRIFAGLARHELAEILAAARHQHFAVPSVILHQEDAPEHVFLLTSGQGAHFVVTGKGQKIIVHWLTAGQVFGGAAMLSSPCPYLTSTEVQTAGCALVWNRRTIRELISRYPILLDNAFSIAVTEHFAWQLTSRISIETEDARARVARLLVALACGIGKSKSDGVEILVPNEDLAAAASVTPYTVSRVIAEWQRAGILTKGRGRILLRHPERLTPQLGDPSSSSALGSAPISHAGLLQGNDTAPVA